jgi:hypothetical protein
MPNNLSSNKCLNQGFVFLALAILGPKELRKQMNIFLRPLMEEVKELWQGIDAYDSHLWSIHDYLAYGKFVVWCVHGRLNCPICMDDTNAFRLQHGKKVSFLLSSKIPFIKSLI